jgi:hypothetical protein
MSFTPGAFGDAASDTARRLPATPRQESMTFSQAAMNALIDPKLGAEFLSKCSKRSLDKRSAVRGS